MLTVSIEENQTISAYIVSEKNIHIWESFKIMQTILNVGFGGLLQTRILRKDPSSDTSF